jgi:hypothetical protein
MTRVIPRRTTAQMKGDFVVFLIGSAPSAARGAADQGARPIGMPTMRGK